VRVRVWIVVAAYESCSLYLCLYLYLPAHMAILYPRPFHHPLSTAETCKLFAFCLYSLHIRAQIVLSLCVKLYIPSLAENAGGKLWGWAVGGRVVGGWCVIVVLRVSVAYT